MYNMVHKQNKYHHKYDLIHFYKKKTAVQQVLQEQMYNLKKEECKQR